MNPLTPTPFSFLHNELRNEPLAELIIRGDLLSLISCLAKIPRKVDEVAKAPRTAIVSLKEKGIAIIRGYLGYSRESPFMTKYKLSLLHVAAICNNLVAVLLLLQAGYDPEPQDLRGWTPAHAAAVLGHRDIYVLLQEHSVFHLTNVFNGSAQDLYNQVKPPPLANDISVRVWDHNKKIVISRLFKEVFKEPEVLSFSHDVHTEPSILIKEWKDPIELPHEIFPQHLEEELMSGYTSMKMSEPKIAIDIDSKDDMGISHKEVGKSLVATAECRPGDTLCEYGGINIGFHSISERQIEDYDYRMCHISAAQVRSYFSLAADSHPNARQVRVKKGGIYRYLLVATDIIKPGEAIAFDYCWHPIKEQDSLHKELRLKALTHFWSSELVHHIMKESLLFRSSNWKEIGLQDRLDYPFYTLSTYYYLVVSGTVTHFNLSRIAFICKKYSADYLVMPLIILEKGLPYIKKESLLEALKTKKFVTILASLLCIIGEEKLQKFLDSLPQRSSLCDVYNALLGKLNR